LTIIQFTWPFYNKTWGLEFKSRTGQILYTVANGTASTSTFYAMTRGWFRFRYSFICQGTSTRRQRSDLFGLKSQAATCYYQSNHSKVKAIPLSTLLSQMWGHAPRGACLGGASACFYSHLKTRWKQKFIPKYRNGNTN